MMTMTTIKANTSRQHLVPNFVSNCIYALESRSLLSTDGLYRINGNCAEIQRLRFLVDSEKPVDLTDKRCLTLHSQLCASSFLTSFELLPIRRTIACRHR